MLPSASFSRVLRTTLYVLLEWGLFRLCLLHLYTSLPSPRNTKSGPSTMTSHAAVLAQPGKVDMLDTRHRARSCEGTVHRAVQGKCTNPCKGDWPGLESG